MWTIRVEYQTGDSFGSDDKSDTIGLIWESRELAREALRSIKEHYTLYKESESFRGRGHDAVLEDMKKYDWWVEDEYYCSRGIYACAVLMDDGERRQVGTSMWCGYFERLYSAKLEPHSTIEDDEKVSF